MKLEKFIMSQYRKHEKIALKKRIQPDDMAYSCGYMDALMEIYQRLTDENIFDGIARSYKK
jgi:hypothetical protein